VPSEEKNTDRRPSQEWIASVQESILDWYKVHRRDLPWRRTTDPYAIWISEVMLQQTQVATVLPYYERFVARFPDIRTLAKACLDDVLKAWEGLGYYARARNMHQTARKVLEEHGGRLPTAYKKLLKLPGIGRYTAAAIASIAFGKDEPVLDGNVTRVLCRLFLIETDPKKSPTRKKLWGLARSLIPSCEASFFNQALMDLGATLCTVRMPRCDSCPLASDCLAHCEGREAELPVRSKRKRIPHYAIATGLVWDRPRSPEAKLLITKRKADDMLGGLWEFPGGHQEPGETLEECLKRELWEELRIEVTIQGPFVTVKHAYSHFRVTLHTYHCLHTDGDPQAIDVEEWRWVPLKDVDQYAFPTADRKIIAELREQHVS